MDAASTNIKGGDCMLESMDSADNNRLSEDCRSACTRLYACVGRAEADMASVMEVMAAVLKVKLTLRSKCLRNNNNHGSGKSCGNCQTHT